MVEGNWPMKRLGVVVLFALVECIWILPAEAASERPRNVSGHAAASRSAQSNQSVQRTGRHAQIAPRRRHSDPHARLTPGREVIDHSGRPQRGRASYYGREFNGRMMA